MMVNGNIGTTWEEDTKALLDRAKISKKRAEDEVVYWTNLTDSLEKVLELTKQRNIIRFDSHIANAENLRQKSIRSSLIEMAKNNNGLLLASVAVHLLMKAKVYTDAKQARGTVYSVLNRDSNRKGEHFVKDRPGVYHLVFATETPLVLV
jgi:hypothetical protein